MSLFTVLFQKWHFSVGFTPVKEWEFVENSTGIISEHLKVCPFNQETDKLIHTEPFEAMFEMNRDNAGNILILNRTLKDLKL